MEDREAIIASIEERYEKLAHQNLYEVLGVERDAETKAIRKAFRGLAKTFHPDQYREMELGETQKHLEELFAKINEANKILSKKTLREAYDQSLDEVDEDESGEELWEKFEIQSAFRKACLSIEQGKFKPAIKLLEAVAEEKKDDLEVLGCLAFAQFSAIPLNSDQKPTPEAQKHLDRLKEISKEKEVPIRIQLFLGRCFLAIRDNDAAIEVYKGILKRSPDNSEAKQKLRLAEMRKQSPPKPNGLWDRLKSLFQKRS